MKSRIATGGPRTILISVLLAADSSEHSEESSARRVVCGRFRQTSRLTSNTKAKVEVGKSVTSSAQPNRGPPTS